MTLGHCSTCKVNQNLYIILLEFNKETDLSRLGIFDKSAVTNPGLLPQIYSSFNSMYPKLDFSEDQ